MDENNYLPYCQPKDVAQRILYVKRYWFHGNPKIEVIGETGQYGKLSFDFADEKVEYAVFLADKEKIRRAARHGIMHFRILAEEIMEQYRD